MAFDDRKYKDLLRRLYPPEIVGEIRRGERTQYPCLLCRRPMWAHWDVDTKHFNGCEHARHRLEPETDK